MCLTSFAVVGGLGGDGPHSGAFGPHLVMALLREGAKVTVLARSSSRPKKSRSSVNGANVVLYDSAEPSTFIRPLRDASVDVVISCVGLSGISAQVNLAEWTKQAGVKLFVPSEWSLPSDIDLPEQSFLYPKKRIHETLQSLGLPYVLFFNGPFADDLFEGTEWTHIRNESAIVVGEGTTPISFCSRTDVARYAAHVLNTFPLSALSNTIFRLEAFRSSWVQILQIYETYHSTHLKIDHISHEQCETMCASGIRWFNIGRVEWDREGSDVGTPEEVERTRNLWQAWHPEVLEDLVKRSVAPHPGV